jgi:hypothetical protein
VSPLRSYPDGAGRTLADPADANGPLIGELKNFHSLAPHAQEMRQAIFELQQDEVIRGN